MMNNIKARKTTGSATSRRIRWLVAPILSFSSRFQVYYLICGCVGALCGCVVECRVCNREVCRFESRPGYFAPRSTQSSIPPGSVNEYQLYGWEGKGRYGSFRLQMNVWVCR